MDDRSLLDEYVRSRSQDAFRQLVDRHVPMVYSAGRRIVRDPQLAEEVAQNVFTTLAQKADSIRPAQVIGGWLYNTTRHLAMNAVRTEQRRREREQTAFAMQTLDLAPDPAGIAEHLEPAMAELDANDRDALVLRYLEDRNLREVGAELGISEDAARKRVDRGLERLRAEFHRQGVAVTSVLLATAITTSASAVPAGLGATISTAALAGTTLTTTATATATKAIAMTTLKKTLIAVTLLAAVSTGIYTVREPSLEGRSMRSWTSDLLHDRDGSHDRALAFFKRNGRKTVPGLISIIKSGTWARQHPKLIDHLPSAIQEWAVDPSETRTLHRIWAIEMCSLIGSEAGDAHQTLIVAHTDTHSGVRKSVAKALAKTQVESRVAVPILAKMLGDSDSGVRAQAAIALGLYGEAARSTVPNLKKATQDANTTAAFSARIGLAMIETPEKVERTGDDRYRLLR